MVVYIPVKGGLGNQMFFYAYFLYLVKKGFLPKLIWFHYLFTKHHAGIEIYSIFNLESDTLPFSAKFYLWLGKMLHFPILKRIMGKFVSMSYKMDRIYIQRTPYSFDEFPIEKCNSNIFIDGFWQNYKYVIPIRRELLAAFKFKLPMNNEMLEHYSNEISRVNSVSIHIRRGDYLEKQFSELNVIKSSEYYFKAIELVCSHITLPVFFVFTDDFLWAKKQFIGSNFIFVEGNTGNAAYLDMYLMSKCKNNIISNSTFSWWGAWLNQNEEKLVIAPSMWTLGTPSSELCPPDWIMLTV